MLETLFVILLFGPIFNNIAEGCGRVPATPTTTPTPIFNPNGSSSAHESPCNATQINKAGCLNGGRCFIIDDLQTASCHCTKHYKGTRCEELADLYIVYQPTTATASIAASLAVAILITIVGVSTAVIYYRSNYCKRKRRQRKERKEEKEKIALQLDCAANGNGGLDVLPSDGHGLLGKNNKHNENNHIEENKV